MQRDAEIGPAADAAVLLQIIDYAQHVVDGDGKAKALDGHAAVRCAGYLCGRNADDIAVHVEQRPAGIAGVDGCVGLQHVDGCSISVDLTVKCADVTGGHGKR